MIERRDRLRFPLEALAECLAGFLDRHGAIEASVASLVDRAHPAFADARQNFVRSNTLASLHA